jgi:hypothetical protein
LVNAKFCFDLYGNTCHWQSEGKITNCGNFFVYYLRDTPSCSLRYCGTDLISTISTIDTGTTIYMIIFIQTYQP